MGATLLQHDSLLKGDHSGAYAPATVLTASGDTTGATDTAAFNAAISKVMAAAGTIYLTPGTYYISSSLVIGPVGGAGAVPVPSIVALNGAGHVGDVAYPTDRSAVSLVATATFPLGQFMIDYQQTPATLYGPSGALLQGFSMECQARSAGLRMQGPRGFHGKSITIVRPLLPVTPGDGANGGFSLTAGIAAHAGYNNLFESVVVMNGTGDGFYYDGIANYDTFVNCHALNCLGAQFNAKSGWVTWLGGDVEEGPIGILINRQFKGTFIGTAIDFATQNAIKFVDGSDTTIRPVSFVACYIGHAPAAAQTEQQDALVNVTAISAAYNEMVEFTSCTFVADARTSDYVYVDGTSHGVVHFNSCQFQGAAPTVGQWKDNSANGVLRFDRCTGINPVGAVTVAVPGTGVAVAAAPYDRTFYVIAGTGGCTLAIQNGASIAVPASGLGTIRLPSGKTLTPTYTNAPTWVVEGE